MKTYEESDGYSYVAVWVADDAIFIEDLIDGSAVVINPNNWELIKTAVDQKIEDGDLGETE